MICNGNWSEDYDEYKKMTQLVLEKHQYLQKFTLLIENSCRIGIYDKSTIGKHVFERKLEKIICCVLVGPLKPSFLLLNYRLRESVDFDHSKLKPF